jgi:hypothetical protein
MHYFRKLLLVLCGTMSLMQAELLLAADEAPRTIVCYSSELSVRPGDTDQWDTHSGMSAVDSTSQNQVSVVGCVPQLNPACLLRPGE